MEDQLPLALFFSAAFAAALAPFCLHRWRRSRWVRLDARVDAAYYETSGKNVFALVDVSYFDGNRTRSVKHLASRRIDVEDISPGDSISILVNPKNTKHCVVDR